MKKILLLLVVLTTCGCSGTGFDKRATLVPDSVTIGYQQEDYAGDHNAWKGATFEATWEFK